MALALRNAPIRRLWQTQPPVGVPVTVDEARDACQSLYSGDDARLLQLIYAAVAYLDGADGVLGRAIMPQTWTLWTNERGTVFRLPLPPLIEVVSVAVSEIDAAPAPLLEGYTVVGDAVTLPSIAAVTEIVFRCGYEVVPENIRLAILMLVRHWYDHPGVVETGRIAIHTLPFAVESLLKPLKVQSV